MKPRLCVVNVRQLLNAVAGLYVPLSNIFIMQGTAR